MSAWVTVWWPIRMFDFFTACTDVNENIAIKCFLKKDETFRNFKNWLRN